MSRDDPAPDTAIRLRSAALVGNPNAGKSALFNALTGARQKDCKAKGRCARCRKGLPQTTDPVTGGRICRLCARQMDDVTVCVYCRSRSVAVLASACTWTSGCQRSAFVCERCAALCGARVCDECWRVEWRSGCITCRAPLPTSPQWEGRYCHGCYAEHFGTSDVGDRVGNDLRCFYCRTCADRVSTRVCTYTPGCLGQVNTCQRCVQIYGRVVCSACWGLHWDCRCFNCGIAMPQWLHQGVECGRFRWSCSRVYGFVVDSRAATAQSRGRGSQQACTRA